jgi:hypothetical protein
MDKNILASSVVFFIFEENKNEAKAFFGDFLMTGQTKKTMSRLAR